MQKLHLCLTSHIICCVTFIVKEILITIFAGQND